MAMNALFTSVGKSATSDALAWAEVQQLLHEPFASSRVEVIRTVSDLYHAPAISEPERQLAEQIFRLLVRDSAVLVREALAESLKESRDIPKDIVLHLAEDVETVATPVLHMSEVLNDEDMLNIIRNTRDIWRHLAISRRRVVSSALSHALMDHGDEEVVKALLDNEGVEFSEASYGRIVHLARTNEGIARKLADRPSLPVDVAEKLMNAVTDEMARALSKTGKVDGGQVAAVARHARELSTMELIAIRNDRIQTERLVRQLYEHHRLTPSLVINALCHGNLDFFELSLAVLAEVPTRNAHILISDPGTLGFRALYDKSDLPQTMREAVRLLLWAVRQVVDDGVRPGSSGFAGHVISRVMLLAQEDSVENLSYILALVRQNAYAMAVA